MSGRLCGIFSTKDFSHASETSLKTMLEAFPQQADTFRKTFFDTQAGFALGCLIHANYSTKPDVSDDNWFVSENGVAALNGYIASETPKQEISNGHYQNVARLTAVFRDSQNRFFAGLDGQFAFAAWNRRKHELWLARGPMGLKPLYYYITGAGLVVFASEPKAILAHPTVSREIDTEGLVAYLTFGYVPGSTNIFKNMAKVAPGQAIKFDRKLRKKCTQYWQPPAYTPEETSLEECAEKTKRYLLENIYQQVKGQDRVGLYFSAGLDSFIVLAALCELGIPEIHTFTAGFVQASANEWLQWDMQWAQRFIKRYQTKHHAVVFEDGCNPVNDLTKIWRQFDEPMLTPNIYTKALLAKAAREQGIDICVTGSSAGVGFRALTKKKIWKLLHPYGKKVSRLEAILAERTRFVPPEKQDALLRHPTGKSKEIALRILERHKMRPKYGTLLELYKDNYLTMHTPDKGITVQERAASLYQVETRVPFLSAKLIDFARTMPPEIHRNKKQNTEKMVLIEAFGHLLPQEVIERKKIGFPSYYWNHSELDPLVERLLSRRAIEKTGILNPDTVETLLEEDRRDTGKSAGRLTWGLLTLQAWHEIHIDGNDELVD